MRSTRSIAVLSTFVLAVSAAPAAAQSQEYRNVISANPFGLLFELFNGEYERVVSESATAGVGGSMFNDEDDVDYVNADAFYRFYPNGRPLDGWAFGAKVGVTKTDAGSFFGYGFDANRSWLMGKNNNFYVGIGFGLKRLVGVEDEDNVIDYVPTLRIINVGFAF